MIRHGSTTPAPKHRSDMIRLASGGPSGESREYPNHVCPGQHCAGRREFHAHRHCLSAVHTLTPAQADAAAKHSGSGRWVGWSM